MSAILKSIQPGEWAAKRSRAFGKSDLLLAAPLKEVTLRELISCANRVATFLKPDRGDHGDAEVMVYGRTRADLLFKRLINSLSGEESEAERKMVLNSLIRLLMAVHPHLNMDQAKSSVVHSAIPADLRDGYLASPQNRLILNRS